LPQRRKDEAKEARMEAMRKEAIMMKKRAVIDKYLATCHLSNNKVCGGGTLPSLCRCL
jgi:hypothetical protein